MSRGGGPLIIWEQAGGAPPRMRWRTGFITAVSVAMLASCARGPDREPALGEAYAGPMALQVREALVARAKAVDTLKHGERVELLGRRRGFYRIRTEHGREGWVDGRQLLSAQEMEALRRLARRAAGAPSQGAATVLEPLNMHTGPYRQAPSFRRIQPEERVDVIVYERVERKPYAPPPLLKQSSTTAQRKAASPKKQKAGDEPLAKPPAPALPDDWLEMSRPARLEEKAPDPGPAAPVDEWALVRSKDGAAGWVLARMLYMAIPDEVAQYAERARIMAYFQIGAVKGKAVEKPVWLWAAQSQRNAEYDFDSLRIFVWSAKRGRWETAFIERGLKGRLPVKLRNSGAGVAGFDIVVEEKDGGTVKRRYELQSGTYRARVAAREAAPPLQSWIEDREVDDEGGEEAEAPQSWRARLGGWLEGLRGRLSR